MLRRRVSERWMKQKITVVPMEKEEKLFHISYQDENKDNIA